MNGYGGMAEINNYISSWFDVLNIPDSLRWIVILIFSAAIFLLILRKILQFIYYSRQNCSLLEITPPATSEKSAYTTQQLFSLIHNLGINTSLIKRLMGIKRSFSFEIVSTKNEGIRYLIKASENDIETIERSVLSYMPSAEIKQVGDYIEKLNESHAKVSEFRLSKYYAHPLRSQDRLIEHDPVAYLTGAMTKLSGDDLIAFQLVISPTVKKEAVQISKMILRNEDVLTNLAVKRKCLLYIPALILHMLGKAVSMFQWSISELIHPSSSYAPSQINENNRGKRTDIPARTITNFESEAISLIQEKINQSLFEAQVRVLVSSPNKETVINRTKSFLTSFASFSDPTHQSLIKKVSLPPLNMFRLKSYKSRLISLINNKSSVILSVAEVSDLYHFPYTTVTKTENIVKVHSRQLPAPLSLKQENSFDVTFAKNTYGGEVTGIGLTREERLRHMYVIGATGTGKSTMLLSMIASDLKKGKGVCVVDPHGDLAESSLNCVPDSRISDVIYFNPVDIKHPIGINLLELTPGLDEDEALIEKEFVAESVISLFRKVFSDAWSAHPHRIEYILRNTIHTAFTLPNPTLFTIFDLLNNPQFQKSTIRGITDENLKNFWKYEFGKAGDYQKVKMVSPVTARIGRFLFSPSARRILEQEKSSINFADILDNKKILICNLSKGKLGEDTSEVMGIMLLNKLQLAALSRTNIEQKKRKNFYLYVDEFQNFATPSFVQMLSEARKYGLNLTMAEQSTSQQQDKNLVQIVLANTGTVVSFRSANPKDEELLLPQFKPYVDFGEIANLPAFRFFMKKAALSPEEPFSGITVPINLKEDLKLREKIINSSRVRYASVYKVKKTSRQSIKGTQQDQEKRVETSNVSGLPA